jgi:hypothetical protein
MVFSAIHRIHAPIAAFTALVVMAGFCLAAGPLRTAGFAAGKTINETDVTIESFVPSPAEEPALLSKTEDSQFTPPWTEFQRIFKPRGEVFDAYRPAWGLGSKTGHVHLKNTILLKLRT